MWCPMYSRTKYLPAGTKESESFDGLIKDVNDTIFTDDGQEWRKGKKYFPTIQCHHQIVSNWDLSEEMEEGNYYWDPENRQLSQMQ